MHVLSNNSYLIIKKFLTREEGQDLVEYALVVALIAFGAIAGMQFLAGGIDGAFGKIAQTVTSSIT